jgi:hypothetical protein
MKAGDADAFRVVDPEAHFVAAQVPRLVPAEAEAVGLDNGDGIGDAVRDVFQTNGIRAKG